MAIGFATGCARPLASDLRLAGERLVVLQGFRRLAPRECRSALFFTSRLVAVVLPSKPEQANQHDRGKSAEAVRHDQVHTGTEAQVPDSNLMWHDAPG
jgi:hypothetical protein